MDHYSAFCNSFEDLFDELETKRLKEIEEVRGATPNLFEQIKVNMGLGKVRKEHAHLDLIQKIKIGESLEKQKKLFEEMYGKKNWGWTQYLRELANRTGCYENTLMVSLKLYRNLDIITQNGWLAEGKSTEFVKGQLIKFGKKNQKVLREDSARELEKYQCIGIDELDEMESAAKQEIERLRRSGESNESRLTRELKEAQEAQRSHLILEQLYRDKLKEQQLEIERLKRQIDDGLDLTSNVDLHDASEFDQGEDDALEFDDDDVIMKVVREEADQRRAEPPEVRKEREAQEFKQDVQEFKEDRERFFEECRAVAQLDDDAKLQKLDSIAEELLRIKENGKYLLGSRWRFTPTVKTVSNVSGLSISRLRKAMRLQKIEEYF